MSEMKRITVRVPDRMKREIDRRADINWSEVVRMCLEKYIKTDDTLIELKNIIKQYKKKKRWDLLKALFLYAVVHDRYSDKYDLGYLLKSNLSNMFGDDAKKIGDELIELLKKIGVTGRYDKITQDIYFYEALLEILLEEGIVDYLEEITINCFKTIEGERELSEVMYHLGLYLRDRQSLDEIYVCFTEKEIKTQFSHLFENYEDIIDNLKRCSIIYENYYDSNAYSYGELCVPIYSYKLIMDIYNNPYRYSLYGYGGLKSKLQNILSDEKNRVFLTWLKSNYSRNFYDEKEIQTFKDEFDKKYGENGFENALNELVKSGILVCKHWPSRSRAGRRKSQSAELYYNLSKDAKAYLYEIVFEKLNAKNKGELENLIEIYEKNL